MSKKIMIALDELLDSKGVTRYELSKRTGTSFQVVDNYYKNKVVRYDSDFLLRVCNALDCDISDIIKLR